MYSEGPWSGRVSQCSRSVKGMSIDRLCCLHAPPSDLDAERLLRICIRLSPALSPAHSLRTILGVLGDGKKFDNQGCSQILEDDLMNLRFALLN